MDNYIADTDYRTIGQELSYAQKQWLGKKKEGAILHL